MKIHETYKNDVQKKWLALERKTSISFQNIGFYPNFNKKGEPFGEVLRGNLKIF